MRDFEEKRGSCPSGQQAQTGQQHTRAVPAGHRSSICDGGAHETSVQKEEGLLILAPTHRGAKGPDLVIFGLVAQGREHRQGGRPSPCLTTHPVGAASAANTPPESHTLPGGPDVSPAWGLAAGRGSGLELAERQTGSRGVIQQKWCRFLFRAQRT